MTLDFEVYVDDVRYAVPSLYLISAADEARARAAAVDVLRASDHHQGVELRRGGKIIYAVGSFAPPGRASADAGAASL
jgi:hypothetical protein